MSASVAEAVVCAAAIAWMATLSDTSWLFLKMARSNAMASPDSESLLAGAIGCVTQPMSFEPWGKTILPSAFTFSTVCAVTASPGLHFFELIGALSAALNAAPDASPGLVWLDSADTDEEADAPPAA